MRNLSYLKNVVTLEFFPDKCTGCGICLEVCPQAVFIPQNGKVQVADRDACMECGACAKNCPAKAIGVQAGVGCANAVMTSFFRKDGACVCGPECGAGSDEEDGTNPGQGKSCCC
jgi:NAD-dependent dihydropyrimidine dehydrogenase PreA subunit